LETSGNYIGNSKPMEFYLSDDKYVNHNGDSKFYSTGCYMINRKGMAKILKKYYNETTNTFTLTGKYVVADQLIYQAVNTYFYLLPTVFTNDAKIESLILEKTNKLGKKATNIIHRYYQNRPFVCIP